MTLYIDIHALQTLPPSNINRDDTGSPKQAIYGGVARHRVSSQAWKRAIRKQFFEELPIDSVGVRTRRIGERIVKRYLELKSDVSAQDAEEQVIAFFTAAGIKLKKTQKADDNETILSAMSEYLLFISNQQIDQVANLLVELDGEAPSKKVAKEALDSSHSLDIALFGRMIADDASFNVDAAAQVAHAIGVSPHVTDFDYFTAVDDVVQDAEETGAAMIGTVEMTSSTLYRYATVNFDALATNLGARQVAVDGAVEFVKAFVESLPTGKQNTFANNTIPHAIVVSVRSDRPISLVTAFENPVVSTGKGIRVEAVSRLVQEAQAISATLGSEADFTWVAAFPELREALAPLGDTISMVELLDQLRVSLENSEAAEV